jgi:hypothetical protein
MTGILRNLVLILVVALATGAWAGGAFEGTWSGIVEKGSGGGSCKEALASATVAGNQVTGSIHHHSGGMAVITGTIADDGSFEGRAGTAHVKGKFSANSFDGLYKSSDCGERKFTMSRS